MFVHPHHDDSFRVDGLCDHVTVVCDVLHHFIEAGSLHLFVLEITQWISHKVEKHTALPQFLDKQLFSIHGWGI